MTAADTAVVEGLLDDGRDLHWEHPARARENAVHCQEVARTLGRPGLRARALAVLGTISLNRGDLRGAFTLTVDAERESARAPEDDVAAVEVAALKAQLSFFSGTYADALQEGATAVELSDRVGDPRLRIFARRAACPGHGQSRRTRSTSPRASAGRRPRPATPGRSTSTAS